MQRESTRTLLLILAGIVLVAGIPRARQFFVRRQPVPKPEVQRAADVVYFYSVDCEHCRKVRPHIERLERERKDIQIMRVATDSVRGQYMFEQWMRRYEVPPEERGEVPALFVEATKKVYMGESDVKKGVEALIREKSEGEGNAKKSAWLDGTGAAGALLIG